VAERLRLTEQFIVESKISRQDSAAILTESFGDSVLIPKIEAIHAGITKNKVMYSSQGLQGTVDLRSGIYSWTHPYPKPVLKNHDTETEPLGRVTNAQFITDSTTGKNAVVVMPTITDKDAIAKILDGRYLTVSIGAETDSATCSICGTNVVEEGWCEHIRGQKYEVKGQLQECYWEAGNIWFNEVSFVNVPADQHAQVVATGEIMMMECYAYKDNNLYNLQVPSDKSLMTNEQANLEGITAPDIDKLEESHKGGTTILKTIEELETELSAKDSKLQESNDKISQLDEQIQKLTVDNSNFATQITELTQSKQELEDKNNTFKAENDRLLEENSNMATQIHKTLAERVVDIKRVLSKPGVETREEAVSAHIERSAQSLQDSLIDLLVEMEKTPGKFVVEKIQHPGVDNSGNKQPGDVTVKECKEDNKITTEDVFYGLLNRSKRK